MLTEACNELSASSEWACVSEPFRKHTLKAVQRITALRDGLYAKSGGVL